MHGGAGMRARAERLRPFRVARISHKPALFSDTNIVFSYYSTCPCVSQSSMHMLTAVYTCLHLVNWRKTSQCYWPSILGGCESIHEFSGTLNWPYVCLGHFLVTLLKTTSFIALEFLWGFCLELIRELLRRGHIRSRCFRSAKKFSWLLSLRKSKSIWAPLNLLFSVRYKQQKSVPTTHIAN